MFIYKLFKGHEYLWASTLEKVNTITTRQKILIVDDNAINLVALSAIIQEVDADVIEASDGYEALEACQEHDFALAILDISMPGMNGYELAEIMRGDIRTKNVPIIFATAAFDDDLHMFKGYQAGAVDYMVKPYQKQVLLAKVRVFLELDRDRRELEKHRNLLEEIVEERVKDIDRLNKILQLNRALDQLIVREKSAQRLIQAACDVIADSSEFNTAWIVLSDSAPGEMAGMTAGRGTNSLEDVAEIFSREDTLRDCSLDPSKPSVFVAGNEHPASGTCALKGIFSGETTMVSGLNHEGHQFGWVGVTLPGSIHPSAQEIDLFEGISSDLGFALHGIATQMERDKVSEELSKTNNQLVRRNEEIQYFYHSLAHELKTPLTTAQEFLSFVSDKLVGDLNETQLEYLGFVRENCSNLAVYINDLLDVTRLDTGKLSLSLETVSLQALVEKILRMISNEVERKGLSLSSQLDESIQDVKIDKSRFAQVLFNVLTNAVKFTPKGGQIEVRLYPDPNDPDWVVLSCRDTGCGIPENQIPYVFRRYYQVENPKSKKTEGFGLGLYLSREIMKLHGGNISVTSSQGKGSTFKLLFPVQPPAIATSEERKPMAYIFH